MYPTIRSGGTRRRLMSTAAVIAFALTITGTGAAAHSCGTTLPTPATTTAITPAVPIFDGFGDYGMTVSTTSQMAQRYHDQGMMLSFGFNHAEAVASFKEATRQDPTCAMCWWGIAMALGPNINAPMADTDVATAHKAAMTALALATGTTEKERLLIEAMAKRYPDAPVADRTAYDQAYADAMRVAAKRLPDDPDVLALTAEALMDLHPWDFWRKDGTAQPWTNEITTLLEHAIATAPMHPLANHLYIHAVEASTTPERALPSAERMAEIAPGAGHLVHMAAHAFIRTGRYHAASLANQRAIIADTAWVAQSKPATDGIYQAGYMPHNHHFLVATAAMEGREKLAMKTARDLQTMQNPQVMRMAGYGSLQHYYSVPLYTMVRFSRWDEILSEPRPATDLVYPTGVWHYARGIAFARTGNVKAARTELTALETIMTDARIADLSIWGINAATKVLEVGQAALKGEIARATGDMTGAVAAFRTAVALEDALKYDEPASWMYPMRPTLGHALLATGQMTEAEAVFKADLRINPENGWALAGLVDTLKAMGTSRQDELAETTARLAKAWAMSDTDTEPKAF